MKIDEIFSDKEKSELLGILSKRKSKILPKKLKIGYASWGECDEKIYEAVVNGLNVVIWFAIDLASDPETHKPIIKGGPDYKKVAEMVKKIRDSKYEVIHLISIGGWNSPHPDTTHTSEEYFKEWLNFNKKISDESLEFYGFDGIDWDIEGNDDAKSPHNYFTIKQLDLMGELSIYLKKAGYFVTMAPAESYVDVTTDEFSLSLLHQNEEWKKIGIDFAFHGRNCYTYLLAKYNNTKISLNENVDTFDFISIQLYEGYTHSLFDIRKKSIPFGEVIHNMISVLEKGYVVDFSSVPETKLGKTLIKIERNKIIIGLANAWATDRFLFLSEDEIVGGYDYLINHGLDCRGFMYWDIGDEGKNNFYMAKILSRIFDNVLKLFISLKNQS